MEQTAEEWREIRGRADSIANAVFLLGGGAFSLSTATLLSQNALTGVTIQSKLLVIYSWGLLLYSVVASILVKLFLIIQAYKALTSSPNLARWHTLTTRANWFLGITCLLAFMAGIIVLGIAAAYLLLQHS